MLDIEELQPRPAPTPEEASSRYGLTFARAFDLGAACDIAGTFFGNTQPVIDAIAGRFPIGVNRIVWELVEDHFHADLKGAGESDVARMTEAFDRAKTPLERWFRDHGVDLGITVVVCGDESDIGYACRLDRLLANSPILLDQSEHIYAVDLEVAFCLNVTFEGDLYAGLSNCCTQFGAVSYATLDRLRRHTVEGD